MPFGKAFRDNPASKGHKIETRRFYERDADFAKMCKAVPFEPGKEPVAQSWWQNTIGNQTILCTGVATKKPGERLLNTPIGGDRHFYAGDTPDTLIEGRTYNSPIHKGPMLKVCAPNNIPGMACMSWWEVDDAEKPSEGGATLCTGLVAVKGAAANLVSGDGLEGESKAKLLTIAGTSGIQDANETMAEGEIIQRIRDKRAGKTKPKKGGDGAAGVTA